MSDSVVPDVSGLGPNDIIPRSRRPPRSPSRRTPRRDWRRNLADRIERQMQDAGYDIWGFVIYRTTYSSEADWAEFLHRLRSRMARAFDRCNGLDILEAFRWTIFNDKSLFDGVDTATIRAHFRQWSEKAAQCEGVRAPNPPRPGAEAARYQFCIQEDEASLHSVVHLAKAPPAPDPTNDGWVKLINKYWLPIEIDPRRQPDWEDILCYEPIEGIRERDIGWMKVDYGTVMREYYFEEEGLNRWRYQYCRPPDIA